MSDLFSETGEWYKIVQYFNIIDRYLPIFNYIKIAIYRILEKIEALNNINKKVVTISSVIISLISLIINLKCIRWFYMFVICTSSSFGFCITKYYKIKIQIAKLYTGWSECIRGTSAAYSADF